MRSLRGVLDPKDEKERGRKKRGRVQNVVLFEVFCIIPQASKGATNTMKLNTIIAINHRGLRCRTFS